jgi:hypothetical protein
MAELTSNNSYGAGISPHQFTLVTEIFPNHLRSTASCISISALFITDVVWLNVAPIAFVRIAWKIYIVFIALSILSVLNVYLFVPKVNYDSILRMTLLTLFSVRHLVSLLKSSILSLVTKLLPTCRISKRMMWSRKGRIKVLSRFRLKSHMLALTPANKISCELVIFDDISQTLSVPRVEMLYKAVLLQCRAHVVFGKVYLPFSFTWETPKLLNSVDTVMMSY